MFWAGLGGLRSGAGSKNGALPALISSLRLAGGQAVVVQDEVEANSATGEARARKRAPLRESVLVAAAAREPEEGHAEAG